MKTYYILDVIPKHVKFVFILLVKSSSVRDAIAVALERIETATIGHINVGLAFLSNLNIFIEIILNCNIYDEAFKW